MWKVTRRTQALLSFEVKFYHILGVLDTFVDSRRLAIAMRLILGIWKFSPSMARKFKTEVARTSLKWGHPLRLFNNRTAGRFE
jgi:hypothetical protein